MLRREERRLRRLFASALAAGVAGPVALAQACSTSSGGAAGGPADATSGSDTTDNVDASEGGFSFFNDGGGSDQYIAWCEAGPPYLVDAGPDASFCEFAATIPCSLPPSIAFIDDAGTIVNGQCDLLCPDAGTGGYTDCNIPDWKGSTAGPLELNCGVCGLHGGRKPAGLVSLEVPPSKRLVGEYFAKMAHLEAASVYAFEVMRAELVGFGAPRALVRAAERAEHDERRHARVTARLARRFGGLTGRPRVRPTLRRSLEAMAVENAVEGCARETFGALLATWQARHARDAGVRRAMASIARDETRHAALAWAFARWAEARLPGAARDRIARERARVARSLDAELSREPPGAVAAAGLLPTADVARRMARVVVG